jgi:hypothetical protein
MATAVFFAFSAGTVAAEECADSINQRMYDALAQVKATEGSGDRGRMCKATRRIVNEVQTAKSVGCNAYVSVAQQYQDIVDRNCKPYGY